MTDPCILIKNIPFKWVMYTYKKMFVSIAFVYSVAAFLRTYSVLKLMLMVVML